MIKIDKLCFYYGQKAVFTGLTFDLPEGINCIEGVSGCGKTTLLRLLARLEKPTAGMISGVPEKVSFLFQEDRLLPWLNAEGNVASVLPKSRVAEASKWLNAVELENEMKALPESLSGGQRRRVALARALAFGGNLLILDEPFDGLDQGLTARMTELILSLGTDVVVTSHSAYETELWGGSKIRI